MCMVAWLVKIITSYCFGFEKEFPLALLKQ